MCACEPGYVCPRCRDTRHDPGYFDDDAERFGEMLHADEWPERIAPALADLEPRP